MSPPVYSGVFEVNKRAQKEYYSQRVAAIYIRGSLNKFPDFFRMGTFIDSTHMKLVLFEVISSGCNALVVPFQQLLEGPMEVLLCERVNDLRHSLFHLLNCLITTASWVLWHINHCRLFNAKSGLYIYIKYIYDL